MSKFPINAELIEVRDGDYAQCYRTNDGDHHWITGWPRSSNVKVGDTGKLVYRKGPSYGLIFFEKDAQGESVTSK